VELCVVIKNGDNSDMKYLLQLEELAQLILGIVLLAYFPIHISGWIWPILFLSPDISMLGYLISPRIGAYAYNLFHHKATAAALIILGYFTAQPILMFSGIILWAHSSFDRVLGFGLKHTSSFHETHLGIIGKKHASAGIV
jgi:hypothetical protein